MSQLILPKLAPSHAAAEPALGAEQLPARATASQPFEDYLDARQPGAQLQQPSAQSQSNGNTNSAVSAPPVTIAPPPSAASAETAARAQPEIYPAPQTAISPEAIAQTAALPAAPIATTPTTTLPSVSASATSNRTRAKTSSKAASPATTPSAPSPVAASLAAAAASVVPQACIPLPVAAPSSVRSTPWGPELPTSRTIQTTAVATPTPSPTTTLTPSPATLPTQSQGIGLAPAPGTLPTQPPAARPNASLATAPAPSPATPLASSPASPSAPSPATPPAPAPTSDSNPAPVPTPPGIEPAIPLATVTAAAASKPAIPQVPTPTSRPQKTRPAENAAPLANTAAKITKAPLPQAQSAVQAAESGDYSAIGTPIAKQSRVMSNTAQLPEAEISLRPEAPATADVAKTAQQPAAAALKTAAPQPRAPLQPGAFSISTPAAFTEKTVSAGQPAATSAPQTFASTALDQVMEAADKMISTSSSHVEVQVNLADGQQLTVRLQISQGSIQPVFKSTSPELRQAIEQNWSGFRTGASERGLEISNPVFESPPSQAGFNASGNRNQSSQPDTENTGGSQPSAPAVVRNVIAPTLPSPLTATPAGSSVQMYA